MPDEANFPYGAQCSKVKVTCKSSLQKKFLQGVLLFISGGTPGGGGGVGKKIGRFFSTPPLAAGPRPQPRQQSLRDRGRSRGSCPSSRLSYEARVLLSLIKRRACAASSVTVWTCAISGPMIMALSKCQIAKTVSDFTALHELPHRPVLDGGVGGGCWAGGGVQAGGGGGYTIDIAIASTQNPLVLRHLDKIGCGTWWCCNTAVAWIAQANT